MTKKLDLYFRRVKDFIFASRIPLARKFSSDKTGIVVVQILFLFFVVNSSMQAQYPVKFREYPDDKKYKVRDVVIMKNSIIVINTPENSYRKPVFVAIKNNLLYDALLLPNLSAEVYLGRQWSFALNGNWSWWKFNEQENKAWYHRIQSAGVELRYWVHSPYPLNGHAVGLYTTIGNYDLRLFPKNEFSKGSLSQNSWSAGVSYAYSVPISCYFNMEFGVALGYVGGKYYPYDYCTEHTWWAQQDMKDRHYVGPTRAEISIVWLLGNGNYRKKREVIFINGKKH